MAKKVSLINMKGGVGKSTLVVNLAWHFAAISKWSKKVLVIDLDPQFNASQYLLGVQEYKDLRDRKDQTVWNIFEQFTHKPGSGKPVPLNPSAVIHNVVEWGDGSKIDLIPSCLELAFSLRNPFQKEQLLAQLVAKIDQEYDLILLDCAPTESFLTTAAYLACDQIVVPVKPEFLSTIGLPLLVNSMEEFMDHYEGHNLHLAGIVFNATADYAPEETNSKMEVKQLAKKFRWYVFDNEIKYSRSYPKGAREGRPIFSTTYARNKVASNFRAFSEEFAQRIKL